MINYSGFIYWTAAVVCIKVRKASFPYFEALYANSEETIHSAEKNDTSYKQAGFFTEMKQKKSKWLN